ncbi:MAG: hypothetical protein ABW042_07455 [Phenylobacterium sp.]
MLKQRREYAEKVAASLFDAEAAIDAAFAKTAALAGTMPAHRKEAGLSALIGQDALEWTSRSIAALAEARRAICEAHKELDEAKTQIGLGAVTMQDIGPETKPPAYAAAPRQIRRVEAA